MALWEFKMSASLTDFQDLTPYLSKWALPSEAERSAVRWRASPEEFRAFYDALLPRLDELLACLDEFALGSLSEEAIPWYYLALAFAEVAPHCELYNDDNKVPNSFDAKRFIAAHGTNPDQ